MKYAGFAIQKNVVLKRLKFGFGKTFLALVIFCKLYWNFTEVIVLKGTFDICIFGEKVTV